MANYQQLSSLIDAFFDNDDPRQEILRKFDQENKPEHDSCVHCYCDPEVYLLEVLWRSWKHKRDS